MAPPAAEPTADIEASIGNKKLSMKSVELNTFVTLLILLISASILVGGALGGWVIVQLLEAHRVEAKEAGAAFVGAVKEQTQATKEQTSMQRERNCIEKFEVKDRPANAEWCRGMR